MRAPVTALGWRAALARRRLFAWNVGVPLLLLAPVALSPGAAPHRPLVFSLFFVLFGTFGACIPLVRDATDGWTEKLLLTGYGERRWLAERLAAEVSLDFVHLLPATLVLLAAERASPGAAVATLAGLLVALAAANVLGSLVAAAVRSLAEGALASAAVALAALHLTGTFRSPAPGSWGAATERWSPFRPLVEALRFVRAAAEEPAASAGAPEGGIWGPPVAAAVLLLILLHVLAPWLARRWSESE